MFNNQRITWKLLERFRIDLTNGERSRDPSSETHFFLAFHVKSQKGNHTFFLGKLTLLNPTGTR
jgi:hypothetical protein